MEKDFSHNNMFFDRKMRKKGFYHNIVYKKDMTYILGARCKDGVVLVGDTKVTVDGGADFAYSKKITVPLTNVVMGSAGMGGLSKEFQNRVVSAVVQMEKNRVEEGRDYISLIILLTKTENSSSELMMITVKIDI